MNKKIIVPFKFIPYVECPDEPQKCLTAGVDGYPTWIFPDLSTRTSNEPQSNSSGQAWRKFEGEQDIKKLSEESGCPLEVENKTK